MPRLHHILYYNYAGMYVSMVITTKFFLWTKRQNFHFQNTFIFVFVGFFCIVYSEKVRIGFNIKTTGEQKTKKGKIFHSPRFSPLLRKLTIAKAAYQILFKSIQILVHMCNLYACLDRRSMFWKSPNELTEQKAFIRFTGFIILFLKEKRSQNSERKFWFDCSFVKCLAQSAARHNARCFDITMTRVCIWVWDMFSYVINTSY